MMALTKGRHSSKSNPSGSGKKRLARTSSMLRRIPLRYNQSETRPGTHEIIMDDHLSEAALQYRRQIPAGKIQVKHQADDRAT